MGIVRVLPVIALLFSLWFVPYSQVAFADTYSTTASSSGRVWDNSSSNDCDNGNMKDTETSVEKWSTGTTNLNCSFTFFDFDISPIPDGSIITNAVFKFDVQLATNAINCDIRSMGTTRGSDTAANIFSTIISGTTLVDNSNFCTSTGTNKSVDLGTTADSEIQAKLSSDFYTFGIRHDSIIQDSTTHTTLFRTPSGTPPPTLEITYNALAKPYYLRTVPITTDSIYLSWIFNGTNVDSFKIEYQDPPNSSWATLVADTGNLNTSYIHTGQNSGNWVNYRVISLNSTNAAVSSPSNESNNITLTDPNMCLAPNALWID